MKEKTWWFDESIQQGVDYNNEKIVNGYDDSHVQFRNYEEEAVQIINLLGLNSGHRVIEFGVGTGAFATYVAPLCKHIDAVDVSDVMLNAAKLKANAARLSNLTFHHGGFLSYDHQGPLADCIVTVHAFHHLPDFWKLVALKRMFHMLKPGGKLFLQDTVFPVKAAEDASILDEWVDNIKKISDETIAQEAIVHIREEFSTYNWILESMIEKQGFNSITLITPTIFWQLISV